MNNMMTAINHTYLIEYSYTAQMLQLQHGNMRRFISALLVPALASRALASEAVFSVHDDLLAFPQVQMLPSRFQWIAS